MLTEFHIIVAIDKKQGIAKNGQIPWHLSNDLKYFKKITTKTKDPKKINAIIMGRKTWESLPQSCQPLPNRLNIIISKTKNKSDFPKHKHINIQHNLEETIQETMTNPAIEATFIIGGSHIYQQTITMPACKNIYVTRVNQDFSCDTFFPNLPKSFNCISKKKEKEKETPYCFEIWEPLPH